MNLTTLKSLVVPGGVLLLCAFVLSATDLIGPSVGALQVVFYAVCIAGALLAWRFHSSRILFALITILLAYRAMEFFSQGKIGQAGPGRIAFEAAAVLISLNFILVSFSREKGLTLAAIASPIAVLFFESVFVAVICRPGAVVAPAFIHGPIFGHSNWTVVPQPALFLFLIALGILLTKLLLYKKPVESGLFWSAAATLAGFRAGAINKDGRIYFATAGLILVSSLIENTYALAYHDELTGLPSRRSFNDTLPSLASPYCIAVVDIDHFKSFNDTYGHETGDEVLRLVAGKLAEVSGGGRAYRVGGEEFSIVFSGKSTQEVVEHLEALRATVQNSRFRVRSAPERRAETRGPDRRNANRPKAAKKSGVKKFAAPTADGELSVTVSIGVAETTPKTHSPEEVIQHADKALYRAKHAGRNRVETYCPGRSRAPRPAGRSIAS